MTNEYMDRVFWDTLGSGFENNPEKVMKLSK